LVPDLLAKTTVTGQVAAPRRMDVIGGAAAASTPVQTATGDPQIRRIQGLLASAEIYGGPINGVRDEATNAAFAAFLARLGPPAPAEPEPAVLEQSLLHYLQDRSWRPGPVPYNAPAPLTGQTEDAILAQIGTKLALLEPPAIEVGKVADRAAVLTAMEALEGRDPRFRGLGYTGWLKLLTELLGARTGDQPPASGVGP
jgi:peptidoglycan hydrolase-like protein with peptidoglycan-binding domain